MLKFGIPQVKSKNCERLSEDELLCIDKALTQLKQHQTVVLTGEDRCSVYKIAATVGNRSGSTAYMAMKDTITDSLNAFQMFDLLPTMPDTVSRNRSSIQRELATQKAEAIRDMNNLCLIVDWFDCPKAVFEKESSALIARCGRNKHYIFMVQKSEGGIACPYGKEELLKAHLEKLSNSENTVLHQFLLSGGVIKKELFEKISDLNTVSKLVEQGWIYSDSLYYRIAAPILGHYLHDPDFDEVGFGELLWILSKDSNHPLSFAELRTVRLVYEQLVHQDYSGKNCFRFGMVLRWSGYIALATFWLNFAASQLSVEEDDFAEANFYAGISIMESPTSLPEDYRSAEIQLWHAYEGNIKPEIPCEYALATLYALVGRERAAKNMATLTLREAAGDVIGDYAGCAWALESIQEPFAFQLAKEVLYKANRKLHKHSLEAALRVLIQSELSTNEDTLLYAEELVALLEETLQLPHPKLADAYIDLGDRYAMNADWDRAYNCLFKASAAYTWILPPSSITLADLFSKISYVKACIGNTVESCHYTFRALRCERKWLSERERATRYISLGKQYEALNERDSAILCYINAVRALADMDDLDEGLIRSLIIHIYEMIP